VGGKISLDPAREGGVALENARINIDDGPVAPLFLQTRYGLDQYRVGGVKEVAGEKNRECPADPDFLMVGRGGLHEWEHE